MANKNEKDKKEKSGGFGAFILIFFILLIWLIILAILVKNDVGGIGTSLRPYLKDVKVIKEILPEPTFDEVLFENGLSFNSPEEMAEYIKFLEDKVDKLTEENNDYAQRLVEYLRQLENFEDMEDTYLENKEKMDEFYKYIVMNDKAPSYAEYVKYYEMIAPDSAKKIYEDLKKRELFASNVDAEAKIIAKMSAKNAAERLSEYTSDIDFVCYILNADSIKTKFAADILSAMDPLFAARIMYRMKELSVESLID